MIDRRIALQGVFEDPPDFLGGMDVECPVCTKQTPPDWRTFETYTEEGHAKSLISGLETQKLNRVWLEWMRCGNEKCEQVVVRVTETRIEFAGDAPIQKSESWVARPRFGETKRQVDPEVRDPFRSDYLEATAILDISPRMSAVLARRIVGDLLKAYAGKSQWSLTARIRSFIDDGNHPPFVTTNLEHLREIADFGAHTQEVEEANESGEMESFIIDADREDAEWTLDIVDRLFEYFVVLPAADEEMRSKWDRIIERTGRKPLRPESDEEPS
jgi:hypothetical protein